LFADDPFILWPKMILPTEWWNGNV
jgi:hypothetical protein